MLTPADLARMRTEIIDPADLWRIIDQLEEQLGVAMRALGVIDVAQSCGDLETIRTTCREVAESIGNAEPWWGE